MKKIIKFISAAGVTGIVLVSAVIAQAATLNSSNLAREAVKSAQEEVKRVRDEAQARVKQVRESLQQRVDKIQNTTKRTLAARVLNQLDNINKVWTSHFALILDHLDNVLKHIESRTDKAQANGRDVSSVRAAIQKAKEAISSAREAVAEQAKKTYLVDVSAVGGDTSTAGAQTRLVSKFREQFVKLNKQLREDLFALRDGPMKEARQAVQEAFQELSKVPNVDREPAGS